MGQSTFYYKNANAPEPNKPNHIGSTILINYDGKVLLEWQFNSMEVNGMGQIANQMLIEAIYKLKGKLKNKKTEKGNEKKGKDRK